MKNPRWDEAGTPLAEKPLVSGIALRALFYTSIFMGDPSRGCRVMQQIVGAPFRARPCMRGANRGSRWSFACRSSRPPTARGSSPRELVVLRSATSTRERRLSVGRSIVAITARSASNLTSSSSEPRRQLAMTRRNACPPVPRLPCAARIEARLLEYWMSFARSAPGPNCAALVRAR